jgi:hypothetical protein
MQPCDLPQQAESWQGAVINAGDDEHPGWLVCITYPWGDLILTHRVCDTEPDTDLLR